MNAHELADWIENGAPFGKYETAKQAVVMLRQQQAEIEHLKELFGCDPAYFEPNTHPVKELNDGGEPVKNATYWKRQYNLMASQNDNLKSGLYHANEQIKYLESHPVKELTLTDEDILEEWTCKYSDCYQDTLIDFARAILRKAHSTCNGFCGEYECKENQTNCLRKAQENG